MPDPANPHRRWVYVWDSAEEAQRFADELNEQPGDSDWHVEPATAPPSERPFGPVSMQLARRGDGLSFALHPLSRAVIRDGFPNTAPAATNVFIDTDTWNEFLKTHDGLADLIEELAPSLTGLSADQLTDLGYAVFDADTDQTWVYVPPAGVARNHG